MHPVLLVIVIIPGAILPLLWMRHLFRRDRLISPRKYVLGVSSHLVICVGLAFYPQSLALYSLIICGLIALSLIPSFQSDAHHRMRMAEMEIAKLKRLLEHHAGNAAMHLALGDAYYDYRLYDQAIIEYEVAQQLDPSVQRAVKGKKKNAKLEKELFENENLPLLRWIARIKFFTLKRKNGAESENRDSV